MSGNCTSLRNPIYDSLSNFCNDDRILEMKEDRRRKNAHHLCRALNPRPPDWLARAQTAVLQTLILERVCQNALRVYTHKEMLSLTNTNESLGSIPTFIT